MGNYKIVWILAHSTYIINYFFEFFQNTTICIKCSFNLDRIDELEEKLKKLQKELRTLKQDVRNNVNKVALVKSTIDIPSYSHKTSWVSFFINTYTGTLPDKSPQVFNHCI